VDYQDYCDHVRKHYPRLHPHLVTLRETIFTWPFVQSVRVGTPKELRALCREVQRGVYVFDMLAPEFCRELVEEIEHFEQWRTALDLPAVRPNTMNNYGVVLDAMGFDSFLHQMMTEYVTPFSSLFYPDVGGDSLDVHHGFIVEYELGKDTQLGFHVDASDVTLNVCLGKEFTGGELFFHGMRCGICQHTQPLPGETFEIGHVPGQAILHRGNHRHGARPITGGERYNLILWCYSTDFGHRQQMEHRTEWCGWPDPNDVPTEEEEAEVA